MSVKKHEESSGEDWKSRWKVLEKIALIKGIFAYIKRLKIPVVDRFSFFCFITLVYYIS